MAVAVAPLVIVVVDVGVVGAVVMVGEITRRSYAHDPYTVCWRGCPNNWAKNGQCAFHDHFFREPLGGPPVPEKKGRGRLVCLS